MKKAPYLLLCQIMTQFYFRALCFDRICFAEHAYIPNIFCLLLFIIEYVYVYYNLNNTVNPEVFAYC